MSDRTTDKVLKELLANLKTAKTELDSLPWQVRPGFGTAKAEAILNVPKLRNEYRDFMLANTIFLFPVGTAEESKKFAEVSSKEGGAVTVDSNEVYDILADIIEPSLGGRREFTVHQFMLMNDSIEDLSKNTTERLTVPQTAMNNLTAMANRQELVDFVKRLVVESHGTKLSRLYMGEKIVDQAIERGFQGKVLVVVALNADATARTEIVAQAKVSRSVEVDLTGKEITKGFAIDTFKQAQRAEKQTR